MCLYSLSTKESRSHASVCRCSFLVPANDRLTEKKNGKTIASGAFGHSRYVRYMLSNFGGNSWRQKTLFL